MLVDLAAQTQEPLTKWMDESQLLEVAPELGLQIRYWHVMDSGKDSVDLLKSLLDRYEQRLSYVIVQNQLRGEQFDVLKSSGQLERALALGAKVVVIKRLQEAAMTKIDTSSTSFWAATQPKEQGGAPLGILERQRVRTWLKSAYESLQQAQP